MKPRPNLLPLSDEDTALWHLVVTRFYARIDLPTQAFTGLWAGSLVQGRRDATLMYVAQANRFVGNICTDGALFDWEFDVIVRLGLVRVYCPPQAT